MLVYMPSMLVVIVKFYLPFRDYCRCWWASARHNIKMHIGMMWRHISGLNTTAHFGSLYSAFYSVFYSHKWTFNSRLPAHLYNKCSSLGDEPVCIIRRWWTTVSWDTSKEVWAKVGHDMTEEYARDDHLPAHNRNNIRIKIIYSEQWLCDKGSWSGH